MLKIKNCKKTLKISNLNHDRDFIHADDLCKAINILKNKRSEGIFNIGSGKVTRLLDILKLINKNKKILHDKNQIKTSLIANISKIKVGFNQGMELKK